MNLKSTFINFYSNILDIYNYLWSSVFLINKIYFIDELKQKKNLYNSYLIIKFLKSFQSIFSMMPFIGKYIFFGINVPINYFDKTYRIVKTEITTGSLTRDIIFNDTSVSKFIDVLSSSEHNRNDLIMYRKCIISDIKLNKISIKKLLDHYPDKSKLFNHSLKNILLLKNIDWTIHDELEINYFHLMKRKTKIHILKDVMDVHLSDLYNLENV